MGDQADPFLLCPTTFVKQGDDSILQEDMYFSLSLLYLPTSLYLALTMNKALYKSLVQTELKRVLTGVSHKH